MTRSDVLTIIVFAAAAIGGYLFMGRPLMADQPYAARVAEIASKRPDEMTFPEALARLESLTQEQPDAAEPHFFIGELLRSQGREDEAVRAYQSALRRDEAYVPAYLALADTLVRLEDGQITPTAQSLYERAYGFDSTQIRAGFMVGLADWQAGNEALADNRWAALAERVEGPRAEMLAAWISAAKGEE